MAAIVRARIAEKRRGGEAILGGVSLAASAGEIVVVTGPSGCGKTTLLNIVAGIDSDFRGQVDLDCSPPPSGVAVSFVFQEPRLLPWRTVRDNILLALRRAPDAESTAARALAAVGMLEWADSYPRQLSLGMARRVALARALAPSPRLLLLDEPFASLDRGGAEKLRALLVELLAQTKTAAVFVTHDLDEAAELADRLLILRRGENATAADIEIKPPRSRRDDADRKKIAAAIAESRSE